MYYKTFVFSCDHPGCLFSESLTSISLAREHGWAFSKDRQYYYCPKCAPMHRNVGRYSYFSNDTLKANGVKYKRL